MRADLTIGSITELDVLADDGDAALLHARIAGLRAVDPDLTIAVLHRGGEFAARRIAGEHALRPAQDRGIDDGDGDGDWRDVLVEVVRCLGGASDGFTGDTTPTSLARLRHWTEAMLRDGAVPAAAAADVILLIDELASNVQEHAPGWMTVDVELTGHGVLVAVSDPQPSRVPVPGCPPPDQPSGRGLMVVAALSTRWGVLLGRSSKAVWAQVEWPAPT